jgi:hypothetical protein
MMKIATLIGLLPVKAVTMADAFDDHRVARQVELQAVVAGADGPPFAHALMMFARKRILNYGIPALCGLMLLACSGCMTRARPAAQPIVASAISSETYARRLAGAKEFFYAAVAGDRGALWKSEQALEELGGEESRDAQVVAYMGACRLLEASHAPFPWDKAALGREGLDLEDRAVADAPDDLEVRFLRGVTDYQLPRFMGRWDSAVADLTAVARVAEREADAGRLDPRAAAAALDYYGKLLEQRYDGAGAVAAWRAAVRLGGDSQGGRDAAKHLLEHHASFQSSDVLPAQQAAG